MRIIKRKRKFVIGATGPNECEAQFREEMMGNGWGASKEGWPDFICYRDDKVLFVEVKPDRITALTGAQRKVMSILMAHGLNCYRWSPVCGFTDIDGNPADLPFEHARPFEKETLSSFVMRLKAQSA